MTPQLLCLRAVSCTSTLMPSGSLRNYGLYARKTRENFCARDSNQLDGMRCACRSDAPWVLCLFHYIFKTPLCQDTNKASSTAPPSAQMVLSFLGKALAKMTTKSNVPSPSIIPVPGSLFTIVQSRWVMWPGSATSTL
jgi:hypothetical protein